MPGHRSPSSSRVAGRRYDVPLIARPRALQRSSSEPQVVIDRPLPPSPSRRHGNLTSHHRSCVARGEMKSTYAPSHKQQLPSGGACHGSPRCFARCSSCRVPAVWRRHQPPPTPPAWSSLHRKTELSAPPSSSFSSTRAPRGSIAAYRRSRLYWPGRQRAKRARRRPPGMRRAFPNSIASLPASGELHDELD